MIKNLIIKHKPNKINNLIKYFSYLFILFSLIILSSNLQAQNATYDLYDNYSLKNLDFENDSIEIQNSTYGIYGGYTLQNNHTIDVGYRKSRISTDSWWKDVTALYIGSELVLPKNNRDFIAGVKVSVSQTILVISVFSFQTAYYTDFSNSQFGFRPEVGIGYPQIISLTYGYNLFTHKNILDIGYHTISLKYFINRHDIY